MNTDGSGLTRIYISNDNEGFWISSVSPTGGYIALTREPIEQTIFLTVIKIATGEVILDRLVAKPDRIDPLGPVGESDWSPDGKQLAFTSAENGLSADLFLYSLENNQVVCLTDAVSTHAYEPSWSPDGKYIVTTAIPVNTTGGVGTYVGDVWATTTDGESTKLYSPHVMQFYYETKDITSWHEKIIEWIGDHSFLATSSNYACENYIRAFDIEAMEETVYWNGCFSDAAYDPYDDVLAVIPTLVVPELGEEYGAFLVTINPAKKFKLTDQAGDVEWSDRLGVFFFFSNQLMAFKPNGKSVELPFEMNIFPVISYDKSTWVWTDEHGTYVGKTDTGEVIWIAKGSKKIFFQPESNNLILCTGTGLYIANEPEYIPIFIAAPLDDCYNAQIVWP